MQGLTNFKTRRLFNLSWLLLKKVMKGQNKTLTISDFKCEIPDIGQSAYLLLVKK